MNELTHTESYFKRRRFTIVLPALVVPFITIIFWILGGGGSAQVQSFKTNSGFNTRLPGVTGNFDSAKDKLSFYNAAAMDSSKKEEQIRMDPYRKDSIVAVAVTNKYVSADPGESHPLSYKKEDADGDPILAKVKAIQQRMATNTSIENNNVENGPRQVGKVNSETRMQSVTDDPELAMLSGMLDKINAVQHPKKPVEHNDIDEHGYTVNAGSQTEATYFGNRKTGNAKNGFHDDVPASPIQVSTITAKIPQSQVLQNGSIVKLELTTSITVNNTSLPAGSPVFGVASLEGERLFIRIPSIRKNNDIMPVALSVYDMDGLEGIYVPGSLSVDVAKESGDNAIQSLGLSGAGMSVKTQAAAAGIGAVKSLLSKKIKQVRITVTAGYQVLLQDKNKTAKP